MIWLSKHFSLAKMAAVGGWESDQNFVLCICHSRVASLPSANCQSPIAWLRIWEYATEPVHRLIIGLLNTFSAQEIDSELHKFFKAQKTPLFGH
jgi:hypothetical protein